ncbi:RNA polymerase sigma factor [Maritimibacter sp. 55A14]|uniref:RNA polymerase sigma factor n=1 Tax=Maritimibacter sp. 55A14 TaxID=2174844 RepID=UPI000D61CBCA|nr:RNA polymerase sigma factor [Maritimibacter sp. 55A14]PWE33831.1 RNA polymerase sigma factor [Maritimibacter sp. 55A14]
MVMPFDALTELSDDVLMRRQAQGDGEAARVLTRRHAPRVLNLAWRMLGDRDEAEDVTQEAMLRLWRAASDWQPGRAQASTWLYRVASNLCTDRLRRRRGVALDAVPEPVDGAPSADQRLMAADRAAALQAALDGLPERQRVAVVLRHLEGLGNPEIAAVMETSVEAVESLLARGRKALAAKLAPDREELGLDR